MEMDNAVVAGFIQYWKQLNFDNQNETYVREAFITPLLSLLGYSDITVNNILREDPHKLSRPYHRIGRSRVDIDYIPTIKLQKFWIIEAKPGSIRRLKFGDLLQAHLYAIHPEVQARYIVLTNGRELKLYDALSVQSDTDEILGCTQLDCDTTFSQLYQALGAKSMFAFIRQQTLSTLKTALGVEVDEAVPDQIQRDVWAILNEARPLIQKKAAELRQRAWAAHFDQTKQLSREVSWATLILRMNMPINVTHGDGQEAARRILSASREEQTAMITALQAIYRGHPYSIFRVHCVDAFLTLVSAGAENPDAVDMTAVLQALEELVSANMTYWSQSKMSNVLVHLENTLTRVAKKACMRFLLQPLTHLREQQQQLKSAEDRLQDLSTIVDDILRAIYIMVNRLWDGYSAIADTYTIWTVIWNFEAVERLLEQMPAPSYPAGDGDARSLEWYGRGHDMLRMGTWDCVSSAQALLARVVVHETVAAVIAMTADDARAGIPASKAPPPEFQSQVTEWLPKLWGQGLVSSQ